MNDKRLDDIAGIVHESLKRLKMGETGVIPVSKEFRSEELIRYVHAYAMHKSKWFNTEYDATSKAVIATRAPPMPWDIPDEVDLDEVL